MKYILTLIIISLTVNANAQKNIYTPIYPLSVTYVNKTGLDSNFNFFLSQSYLDSLRFAYDSIKSHRNAINTTTTNLTNLTNLEKTDVAGLKATDISLQNQINSIVVPPTAGVPKPIFSNGDYIINDTCYNRHIWMQCSNCTVWFPTNITPGVVVYIHAPNGQVNFKAVTTATKFVESSVNKMALNGRFATAVYKKNNEVNVR